MRQAPLTQMLSPRETCSSVLEAETVRLTSPMEESRFWRSVIVPISSTIPVNTISTGKGLREWGIE